MILVPVAIGTATSIGARRTNEDRSFVAAPWIFVLDGVGGSRRGGAAAQIGLAAALHVTAMMPTRYRTERAQMEAAEAVVREAHRAVMDRLGGDQNTPASGSSAFMAVHIQARSAAMADVGIATVGDISCWTCDGRTEAIEVTGPERASNRLESALGWPDVDIAVQHLVVPIPSRIAVLTDGARAIETTQIRNVLGLLESSATSCAELIVTQAAPVTRDNATACVVDIGTRGLPADYLGLPAEEV